MKYNPDLHHRRSIRLRGYDYAQAGVYFVTICTHDRASVFGEIANGKITLNDAGRMVEKCWNDIPTHFPHAELDEFIVMPNHIHGILSIIDAVGAKKVSPPPMQQRAGASKTIGSIIRGFKIGVNKWMREQTPIHDVWQRNYFEHIIRDESSLHRIREYIAVNPACWAEDSENPENAGARSVDRDVVRTVHGEAARAGTANMGAKDFSPLRADRDQHT